MGRAFAIIFLAMGVAGFGLCALCSGAYSVGAKYDAGFFMGLSVVMIVLTVLCVWGIMRLSRAGKAKVAAGVGPADKHLPPPPPTAAG